MTVEDVFVIKNRSEPIAVKVSPSSLYNHISGREQIVELLPSNPGSRAPTTPSNSARKWCCEGSLISLRAS